VNDTEIIEFSDFGIRELEAFAHERAADLGLSIADAYFPSVLENLAALQAHAAILGAALEAVEPLRPVVP
jgi:hypothetical protein